MTKLQLNEPLMLHWKYKTIEEMKTIYTVGQDQGHSHTGCLKKRRYSFCQSGPNQDVIRIRITSRLGPD